MSQFDPQDAEETAPRAISGPAAASGTVVAGKYRIQRMIARGGMSTVYLAEQLPLGRLVALKIVAPPASEDPDSAGEFEQRFRLEAETLAALHHPNIVVLHDYGRDEFGRYFLVMEYVDGPRFLDLLSDGPLSCERGIALVQQVLAALRHAHGRGVVHRDLKPSNLLVERGEDGRETLKVVDFGLVKVMEGDQGVTRTGLVLGSPHFMSPEQCRGEDIDHRTDVYAVGVLLFRSLTGTWPFHGNTPTATMLAHLHDPLPVMPRLGDRPWPVGLESVVRRCLARDPGRRWADVGELSAALGEVLAGRGVEDSASLALPAPRRPVWPWIATAGLLLTAAVFGWFFLRPAPAVAPPAPPEAAAAEPAPPTLSPPGGAEAARPDPEPDAPAGEPEAKPAEKPEKPAAKPADKPATRPPPAKPAPKADPPAGEAQPETPDGYMPLPDALK